MADASRGSADSYIGSFISLTSKSEIRYEGVLYTLDTVNSNIALKDVRTFGTEGRKKDGPQIPPSDRIYDYIIFRAADIKDLQVKSSPPVQSSMHDPAIVSVQTQYSGPAAASSFTHPLRGNINDGNIYGSYSNISPAMFQSNVPSLYPPSGLGSWGLPPGSPVPPGSTENLALPLYWPQYYRPAPGHPHLQHPPPLPLQAPAIFPGLHSSTAHLVPSFEMLQQKTLPMLGTVKAPLPQHNIPAMSSTDSVVTVSDSADRGISGLFSSLTTSPSTSLTMELLPDISLPDAHGLDPIRTSGKLPEKVVNPIVSSVQSSQASGFLGQSALCLSTAAGSLVGQHGAGTSHAAISHALLAPSQLPHSGAFSASAQVSATTVPPTMDDRLSDLPKITSPVISTSSTAPSQQLISEPLLPLPTMQANQENVSFENSYQARRGRGRGRGSGVPHSLHSAKHFTEDFDFTAMNEKFNKDEVWGELGKGDNKTKGAIGEELTEYNSEELETGFEQSDYCRKPVYIKNDFFDTLSCGALGRGENRSQRANLTERRKIDTETFGSMLSRPHNSRGGRLGGYRGGYRGTYYGNKRFTGGNAYGGRFRAVSRTDTDVYQ